MHNWKLKWVAGLMLACGVFSSFANQQSWRQFLSGVRTEAKGQGIRTEVINSAFRGLRAPDRRVERLDRTQPEKRLTFRQYRRTRAGAYRIKLGRREFKKYRGLLNSVSQHYGVSPCFITSIWGLETSYGRFKGSFPVIKSLATLAYRGRRTTFFRKELLFALHILNEGHIDLPRFKGEWAGASGHPQFLPSSWYHYAQDFSGDGVKDIWNNIPDAFASIANYLKQNGWKDNTPWAIAVRVPSRLSKKDLSLKVTKSVRQWSTLGVTPIKRPLPQGATAASIIEPYGGPAMMVFNNFKVIMRWNYSSYYAGTVGYMAEKICRRPL